MDKNKKIINFYDFMNYFEVKYDLEERIKIYEIIQLWSGIQNIVISWNVGKKFKFNNESNNTLQNKKKECLNNKLTKTKLLNSTKLYNDDANIINLFLHLNHILFLEHKVEKRNKIIDCTIDRSLLTPENIEKYKNDFIQKCIKKGYYTPEQFFEMINSIKNDSISLNKTKILKKINKFLSELLGIVSVLYFFTQDFNDIFCSDYIENLFLNFFIENEFIYYSNLSYFNKCIEYKSNSSSNENEPEYIPYQMVKIFKKGEKVINSVKKEKLIFLHANNYYHTYYIFSSQNIKYLYVLFNSGLIWDTKKILNYFYLMNPESEDQLGYKKNKVRDQIQLLKNYFESIYDNIKNSYHENIILCGHSEGSVYSQAFCFYLWKYHPEILNKIYIIGSGEFCWYFNADDGGQMYDFSKFIKGKNIQFGYFAYHTYTNKNNQYIQIAYDPYTLCTENNHDCIKPHNKILYISGNLASQNQNIYHLNKLNNFIYLSKLFKYNSSNKNINIFINQKKIILKYNKILISKNTSILHDWKPSYFNAFMFLYNEIEIPSINQINNYMSNINFYNNNRIKRTVFNPLLSS